MYAAAKERSARHGPDDLVLLQDVARGERKRRPSRHCGNCCSDTRTRDSTTTRAVWLAEAHLDCFWPPRRGLGCARVHAFGALDLAALLYAISAFATGTDAGSWLVTQPATRFSPAPVPQSCFCPGSWEQVDLIAARFKAIITHGDQVSIDSSLSSVDRPSGSAARAHLDGSLDGSAEYLVPSIVDRIPLSLHSNCPLQQVQDPASPHRLVRAAHVVFNCLPPGIPNVGA